MIVLPYPPKVLNPNRSKGKHWGTIAKARKKYRGDCLLMARPQIRLKGIVPPETPLILLQLRFRPPFGIPPDDDNIIAAFKSGRDALAEALGIDDKRFRSAPIMGEPTAAGCVEVELLPLTEDTG